MTTLPPINDFARPGVRAVVLNSAGEVLLLRRPDGDALHPGTWCLPGGAQEDNEDPLQGAGRELIEETGLSAQPTGRFVEFFFPDGAGYAYLFRKPSGALRIAEREVAEARWCAPSALPQALFPCTLDILFRIGVLSFDDWAKTLGADPKTARAALARLDAELTSRQRGNLEAQQFAYPRLEKEPLEDAEHVRQAIARFGQVEGASEEEHREAWRRILEKAGEFGVHVADPDMPRTDADVVRIDSTAMVMRDVFHVDRGTFKAPTKTPEGYLKAPAYASRIGVLVYLTPEGNVRRELVLPEHLFDAASMATLQGQPVTNEHPPALLDATTAPTYTKGWTGASVTREGDYLLVDELTITDGSLVDDVVTSRKRETSAGYACDLVMQGGKWRGLDYDAIQTNRRYNHLAVVSRGRAGHAVRIRMDAATEITPHDHQEDPMSTTTIKIDSIDYANVPTDLARAIQAAQRLDAGKLEEMTDKRDKMVKTLDDLNGQIESLKQENEDAKKRADTEAARADAAEAKVAKLEGERMDGAAIRAAAAARATLVDTAKKIVPATVKLDDLDDDVIRLEVAKAGFPKISFDGKSADYIQAMFDAAVAEAGTRKDSTRTLGRVLNTDGGQGADDGEDRIKAAKERQRQDSEDGWKSPGGARKEAVAK